MDATKPKRRKQIHVKDWVHQAIALIAVQNDCSMEAVTHQALTAWLAQHGIQEPKAS